MRARLTLLDAIVPSGAENPWAEGIKVNGNIESYQILRFFFFLSFFCLPNKLMGIYSSFDVSPN